MILSGPVNNTISFVAMIFDVISWVQVIPSLFQNYFLIFTLWLCFPLLQLFSHIWHYWAQLDQGKNGICNFKFNAIDLVWPIISALIDVCGFVFFVHFSQELTAHYLVNQTSHTFVNPLSSLLIPTYVVLLKLITSNIYNQTNFMDNFVWSLYLTFVVAQWKVIAMEPSSLDLYPSCLVFHIIIL